MARSPSSPLPTLPRLDVVIPCLNEAETLPHLLEDLTRLELTYGVVVADGGSRDGTPEVAEAFGAKVVKSPPGRAWQMNTGAAVARAPWLLFLHADVRFPSYPRRALHHWLSRAGPNEFGTFAFAVDAGGTRWRLLEAGQRLRERFLGLAYGDQGLIVSARLFRQVGGFPPLPLLEDAEILRALRRVGTWKRIPAPLPSSPRRYLREGVIRTWFRNALITGLYLAGTSPVRLASLFPRGVCPPFLPACEAGLPGHPAAGQRQVLVFVKDPVAGKVKTRLAREVGKEQAASIYRGLGRRVVDALRGGSYRLVVLFHPPEARKAVGRWLGEQGVEFRPQAAGDLGERLESAFAEAFRRGGVVAAVASDTPGVDRGVLEAAFRALERADVVVGPSPDGGYYLIALRRPAPELFRGIPWSSPYVLAVTRERILALGWKTELLPPLADVDTLEDWLRMGRPGSPGEACS